MELLSVIFTTVAGGIANRFRGGGVLALPGETKVPDHKRTQVRRVVCAAVFGLLAWNPWVILAAYLSFLTGWGFPVSAAIGAKTGSQWEPEFGPLDAAAKWLTEKVNGRYEATLYGTLWLTLHGLFFGLIAAVLTQSVAWLLLAGFGLCYKLSKDWERGELIAGALWGLAITVYLGV